MSHDAPTLPLEPIPARKFLRGLGSRYCAIKAAPCISAHWNTPRPAVNTIKSPETIHDFSGFPSELYLIQYTAHSAPALAEHMDGLVNVAGISCDIDHALGLDHDARVPLMLMFPNADVPVVRLSVQRHLDPAQHRALGESIALLRHDGFLSLTAVVQFTRPGMHMHDGAQKPAQMSGRLHSMTGLPVL